MGYTRRPHPFHFASPTPLAFSSRRIRLVVTANGVLHQCVDRLLCRCLLYGGLSPYAELCSHRILQKWRGQLSRRRPYAPVKLQGNRDRHSTPQCTPYCQMTLVQIMRSTSQLWHARIATVCDSASLWLVLNNTLEPVWSHLRSSRVHVYDPALGFYAVAKQ